MAEGFGSSERLFDEDVNKQEFDIARTTEDSTTESPTTISDTEKSEIPDQPVESAATANENSDVYHTAPSSTADSGSSQSCLNTEGSASSRGDLLFGDIFDIFVAGGADAASLRSDDTGYSSGVLPSVARQLFVPSDVADVLRAAARAREVARCCRRVMMETLDSGTVGKQRIDEALQRAEGSAEFHASQHYRNVAALYSSVTELAARMAHKMEMASNHANTAASRAQDAAKVAQRLDGEIVSCEKLSAVARDIMVSASAVATDANVKADNAYRMEHRALRVIKKCWHRIYDAENTGTAQVIRRQWQLSAYGESICVIAIQYISLVLGGFLLGASESCRSNTLSYQAIICIGVMLVVWPVFQTIYRVVEYFYKKREICQKNETRQVIAKIDDRLQELDKYFIEYEITPVASDSEIEP